MGSAREPRGFGAPAASPAVLCPEGGPTLSVPADLPRRGPHRLWPEEGAHACILVSRCSESLGALEGWVAEAARLLAPGGRLVVSVENLASLRQLRRCLEGRPGGLEPGGVPGEAELAADAPRMLRALAGAGLVVRDLLGAAFWNEEAPPGLAADLHRNGFLAARLAFARQTARLWCVAEKVEAPLLSALVAVREDSPPEDLSHTLEALAVACPEAEVVAGAPAARDVDSWNEAVPRSAGAWVWLLRAGDHPSPGDLEALAAQVELGPVAPAPAGTRQEAAAVGDLGGLLLTREALFAVGPFPREWESEQVAGEEWLLRAEAFGFRARTAPCRYAATSPRAGPAAAEGPRFLERYAFLEEGWGTAAAPVAGAAGASSPLPWAGRKPRVSLCMIVRDEERFLPSCLGRAREACDEIVVVDTGSTDRTVEIARSFGARVLAREWDDDFSAPRNLALAEAAGDWILALDADEFLEEGAAAAIRRCVEDPGVAGYHLEFRNRGQPEGMPGILMLRLYRNLPGLRYVNRIHEQVAPSLLQAAEGKGLRLGVCPARVLHVGYTGEVMEQRGKQARNLALFRRHIEEHPDDVYNLYKFSDFLRRNGDPQEMMEFLERTMRLLLERPPSQWRNFPFAAEVGAMLALELAGRKRWKEAEEVLAVALTSFIPTPNLHFVAGGFCMRTGEPSRAIEHYRRCLSWGGQSLIVPVSEGITGAGAVAGLAAALLERGEARRAEVVLRRLVEENPGHETAAVHHSSLLARTGRVREALDPLMACLRANPRAGSARLQGACVLLAMGLPGFAITWTERARETGQVPDEECGRILEAARALALRRKGRRAARRSGRERDSLEGTETRTETEVSAAVLVPRGPDGTKQGAER